MQEANFILIRFVFKWLYPSVYDVDVNIMVFKICSIRLTHQCNFSHETVQNTTILLILGYIFRAELHYVGNCNFIRYPPHRQVGFQITRSPSLTSSSECVNSSI